MVRGRTFFRHRLPGSLPLALFCLPVLVQSSNTWPCPKPIGSRFLWSSTPDQKSASLLINWHDAGNGSLIVHTLQQA